VAVPRCGGDTNPQRGNLGYITMDEEVQTDPENRTAIETRMSPNSRTTYPCFPFKQTRWACRMPAIQSQDAIGWDNFFEGCSAKDWEQEQDAYYNGAAAANPHGDGPQHLFRSFGKWHGICGSTIVMASFTLPRTLRYSMAWKRPTTKFAPNSNRALSTGYNKETMVFHWAGERAGILVASMVYRQRWLQRVQKMARARASRRQAET
jgi:hypothetical protein